MNYQCDIAVCSKSPKANLTKHFLNWTISKVKISFQLFSLISLYKIIFKPGFIV